MARILIVDDSFTARTIVERLLGNRHQVSGVSGGRAALDSIRQSPPDLMLLDLLMPDMDGFAVLHELREIGSTLPVLVLSADIQDSTLERVRELGAAGIVNKPLTVEKLNTAIERVLSGMKRGDA